MGGRRGSVNGSILHFMTSNTSIPPEVAELLRKVDKLGAMKLVMQTKGAWGSGQKISMDMHDSAGHSVHFSGTLSPEVLTALKGGNKIEAIKLLRTATGLGLVEAKAAIEGLEGSAA